MAGHVIANSQLTPPSSPPFMITTQQLDQTQAVTNSTTITTTHINIQKVINILKIIFMIFYVIICIYIILKSSLFINSYFEAIIMLFAFILSIIYLLIDLVLIINKSVRISVKRGILSTSAFICYFITSITLNTMTDMNTLESNPLSIVILSLWVITIISLNESIVTFPKFLLFNDVTLKNLIIIFKIILLLLFLIFYTIQIIIFGSFRPSSRDGIFLIFFVIGIINLSFEVGLVLYNKLYLSSQIIKFNVVGRSFRILFFGIYLGFSLTNNFTSSSLSYYSIVDALIWIITASCFLEIIANDIILEKNIRNISDDY
ncbi:hypothetical protein F8M41_000562 [Gigaspora margarita]|uniref:Uncharacterized protein n=1 Tax=Gigaspora margarita TaxID=4874 RepID=A0A8H4A8I5_GIGMA|nr:hypothetical protein F8M41_000562 [Gigaspora margarita]